MKKYEFTDEVKVAFGITLHRIRALISFRDVKAGDLGGFIEKEDNLSQSGDAWVCGDARVYDDARVCGNAWVCGDARVYNNARVCGDAWVYNNARVYNNAQVYGDAWVYNNARVCGDAWVYDDARVCGNAWVYGDARVCGNAWVYSDAAMFCISGIGSRADTSTFFLCKDKKIRVSCGCFLGDLDEFAAKVQKTHGDNRHGEVYRLAIEMAKAHIIIPADEE